MVADYTDRVLVFVHKFGRALRNPVGQGAHHNNIAMWAPLSALGFSMTQAHAVEQDRRRRQVVDGGCTAEDGLSWSGPILRPDVLHSGDANLWLNQLMVSCCRALSVYLVAIYKLGLFSTLTVTLAHSPLLV